MLAHRNIVGLKSGLSQIVLCLRFEPGQILLTGAQCFTEALQGSMQMRCAAAFLARQVAIARRQCKSVTRADGLAGHDIDGQCQLAHHVADHQALLIILLAKHCNLGGNDVEKLRHHGGHAGEKPRPKHAFELIGQFRRRYHLQSLRFGI